MASDARGTAVASTPPTHCSGPLPASQAARGGTAIAVPPLASAERGCCRGDGPQQPACMIDLVTGLLCQGLQDTQAKMHPTADPPLMGCSCSSARDRI
jgi:hypothetical protein